MICESIKIGVQNRDVTGLRDAIGNICFTSSDFSSGDFDEAIKYVESNGIKLREDELVGELISANKTRFTDEDFVRAIFELQNNFCNERIADVKKIGRAMYSENKKQQTTINKKVDTTKYAQRKVNVSSKKVQSHQKLPIAPIAIGVLVAIAIIFTMIWWFVKR